MSRKKIFLINEMKNQIMGSKFPSKHDCLSVLFFNMRVGRMNLHESTSLVIDECLIFWKKARIPTHDRSYCIKKITNLYNEWRKLDRNKTRESETLRKKEHDFQMELDNLFDIAHNDADNLIKHNEDKQFLVLQRRKGRPGCMLGVDMKLTGLEKRREERIERHIGREKREEKRIKSLKDIEYTGKISISSCNIY